VRGRSTTSLPPLDGEGRREAAGRGAPATYENVTREGVTPSVALRATAPPSRGSGAIASRARALRADMTPEEKIIWRLLKSGDLAALHFRRQAPFQNYILDFVSHAARLVVEVDGAQHAIPEHKRRDAVRTALLQAEGYVVLRFWNNDVHENPEGVWRRVRSAAERSPAAPRLLRWRQARGPQTVTHASSSMGEIARSAEGGAPAQSSGHVDCAPIAGRRGASSRERV